MGFIFAVELPRSSKRKILTSLPISSKDYQIVQGRNLKHQEIWKNIKNKKNSQAQVHRWKLQNHQILIDKNL